MGMGCAGEIVVSQYATVSRPQAPSGIAGGVGSVTEQVSPEATGTLRMKPCGPLTLPPFGNPVVAPTCSARFPDDSSG
jgi:hypothetical protein